VTERTLKDDEDLIRRLDAERGGAPLSAGPVAPAETATRGEWTKQDAALRLLYGPVLHEDVPDGFAALIEGARREEVAAKAAAAAPERADALSAQAAQARMAAQPTLGWRLGLAAAVALLALGTAFGLGVARLTGPSAQGLSLAQSALMAHRTFAPEVVHPVEVAASDAQHLSAWMTKRVGLRLVPPDFTADGFRLIGGRVLPDMNGTAAAMMYEDGNGRRVTVFVAPEPGQVETALRFAEGEGSKGFWWIDGGFGCAVVGDAPRDVLKTLAGKAYEALTG
jgi:anti-sigma factor RsiW